MAERGAFLTPEHLQPGALVTIAIGRGLCQGELVARREDGTAAITGPYGPLMGHLVTPWRPQATGA